ncbi:MAG: hypothetical protein ACK480_04135, partial [Planctomycetota bacterium]
MSGTNDQNPSNPPNPSRWESAAPPPPPILSSAQPPSVPPPPPPTRTNQASINQLQIGKNASAPNKTSARIWQAPASDAPTDQSSEQLAEEDQSPEGWDRWIARS